MRVVSSRGPSLTNGVEQENGKPFIRLEFESRFHTQLNGEQLNEPWGLSQI